VLAEGALFGLGVVFFRLLDVAAAVELRAPRAFPFGQPCCFFAFGSSGGAEDCIAGGAATCIPSSGGVCVCGVGSVGAASADVSKGSFMSTTARVCWT